MRSRAVLASAFVVCASLALGAAQADRGPRPATIDDAMALRSVGSPAIAPDGRMVLYTIREWRDAERDERPDASGRKESRTEIWRVGTDGAPEARQLTFGPGSAASPTWSPDGRFIGFLAARGRAAAGDDGGPKTQVWIMPADGGEAWALTSAPEGVQAYAWSPDGRRVAYVSQDPLAKADDERRKRRDDPKTFEGDFRYAHLWVIDVASREAARLTEGTDYTVSGDPSWAPDGTRLAFTAAPTPLTRDTRADVYVVTVSTRRVDRITTNPGPDSAPAWSPDGATIAYLSEPNDQAPKGDGIPLQHVGNAHLMLYDVASGRAADAASASFDLSPGEPVWAPGGRRVYFTVGRRAFREMFAYDAAARQYVALTDGALVGTPSFSRDGSRAAFVRESASEPADVYVSGPAFAAPRRLTTANPQLAGVALGAAEVITWNDAGTDVEGVLLKPVGYQPGTRYPLLVVAHGGPTGAHTDGFKLADGGQVWAGAGWAVLYPNPRGSTNYGERFMRANIGDWGGGDYRDIMTGVDAVIDRGVADPSKLAVMGWSYGGYLTCWIVSQTSRFKAAMMGAGLSDLVSMYGTTDIPDYLGTFFNGIPSAGTLPLYRERSGLTGVDAVTTPLLILQGGSDERVPTGQSMEFYRALRDRGKTVALVFYPREGHGLREYYHVRDRLTRQFEWITRYTLGEPTKQDPQ
jgi:dipeptidyl aminopeptidase/acylaminoacyl peptidase